MIVCVCMYLQVQDFADVLDLWMLSIAVELYAVFSAYLSSSGFCLFFFFFYFSGDVTVLSLTCFHRIIVQLSTIKWKEDFCFVWFLFLFLFG